MQQPKGSHLVEEVLDGLHIEKESSGFVKKWQEAEVLVEFARLIVNGIHDDGHGGYLFRLLKSPLKRIHEKEFA
jgi:hypothetical protein